MYVKTLRYFKTVFNINKSDIHIKTFTVYSGYSSGYAQGTGPILFGYLDCNGTEANLVECTQDYNNTHTYCQSHDYDVAIVCKSKYLNILNVSMHYIN